MNNSECRLQQIREVTVTKILKGMPKKNRKSNQEYDGTWEPTDKKLTKRKTKKKEVWNWNHEMKHNMAQAKLH